MNATPTNRVLKNIYEPISQERLAEIKRIANEDARRILKPVRRMIREIFNDRRGK